MTSEWEAHQGWRFMRYDFIDGSHQYGGAVMRRKTPEGWQYRRMTPEELDRFWADLQAW